MKNLKKRLAGLLVLAMVLSLVAPGAVAKAEAPSAPNWAVDFTEEVATKNENDLFAGTVQYTVVTEEVTAENVEDKAKAVKATAWETLDADMDEIDLSWVKKNKAASLIIRYTTGNEEYSYQALYMPAQEATLKVGLSASATTVKINRKDVTVAADRTVGSADTGYLFFYKAPKNAEPEVVDPRTISWKKGVTGSYEKLLTLADNADESAVEVAKVVKKLNTYKAKGATLYFTTTPTVNAWMAKEVKFAYKKQANAPKVNLDYVKRGIALKAGQEYQVRVGGTAWPTAWQSADELKPEGETRLPSYTDLTKLKVLKIVDEESVLQPLDNDLYDGTYEVRVRVAANSTKGTIPSKITVVDLPVQEATTETIISTENVDNKVVVELTDETKGKVKITNNTDDTYAVTYVNGTTKTLKTINKDKNATFSDCNLDTGYLLVGIAGVKPKTDVEGKIAGKEARYDLSHLKSEDSDSDPEPELSCTVNVTTNDNVTWADDTATVTVGEDNVEVDVTLTFANLPEGTVAAKLTAEPENPSITTELTEGNITIADNAATVKLTVKADAEATEAEAPVVYTIKVGETPVATFKVVIARADS